jgi:DNA-directed RNA polymerase subunit omega
MVVIEDCLKVVPNKFELVLLASYRAKTLINGSSPLYDNVENDKNSIVSLNEISKNLLDINETKENIENEIKEESVLKIYNETKTNRKIVVGSNEEEYNDNNDIDYQGDDDSDYLDNSEDSDLESGKDDDVD